MLFRKDNDKIKNLEKELDLYKSILSEIDTWVLYADTGKNIIYCSKACYSITGYTSDEFMAATDLYFKIVHKEDLQRIKNAYELNFKSSSSENYIEFRIKTKQNKTKWIGQKRKIIYDENSEPIGIQLSNKDLSIIKKNELELIEKNNDLLNAQKEIRLAHKELILSLKEVKESEARFEALSVATYEAVFFFLDGKCIDANESATKIFGYSLEEFKKMSVLEGISEEFHELVLNNMKTNYMEPYEIICIRKNGEKFSAEVQGKLIKYKGNNIRVTIVRDITERKKNEEELKKQNKEYAALNEKFKAQNEELFNSKIKAEESDRLKSAFLANMSHEIRTPMNSILGFSEMLQTKGLDSETKDKYASIISQSSKQLLAVVNDILDISKIETGQVSYHPENININKLFNQVYNEYKIVADKKRIKLIATKTEIDENANFTCDFYKIKQALNNLISNAIKFTEIGFVEFGYKIKDDTVEFYVEDSGIGISPKSQLKIFERFNQEDNTIAPKFGGTGLGLPIAKANIEICNGKIWVESEKNKGSKFIFTFPFKKEKVKTIKVTNEIKKEKKENWKDALIMIVEDEYDNYYFLEEMLKPTNIKIIHAKNGEEAFKFFTEYTGQLKLILMDIKLPDINGFDITKELRKINKNIPIIAQTAFAMSEDRKKAIEAGCNAFLTKPIIKKQLYDTLEQFLN